MQSCLTLCPRFRAFLKITAVCLLPFLASGQDWPSALSTTPTAQRNALGALRNQVRWVENATRSVSSVGDNEIEKVRRAFLGLRLNYGSLKNTLNPNQLESGANDWAELDAGLDIIQEAFTNFDNDIAAGQNYSIALRNLCRVVREGTELWLQELEKDCRRLRVGWGS